MARARSCVPSAFTSRAKKPLVSTKISSSVDDLVDFFIAQRLSSGNSQLVETVEGIVRLHFLLGDGFQAHHRFTAGGQNQGLALLNPAQDALGVAAEFEDRNFFHGLHSQSFS